MDNCFYAVSSNPWYKFDKCDTCYPGFIRKDGKCFPFDENCQYVDINRVCRKCLRGSEGRSLLLYQNVILYIHN